MYIIIIGCYQTNTEITIIRYLNTENKKTQKPYFFSSRFLSFVIQHGLTPTQERARYS